MTNPNDIDWKENRRFLSTDAHYLADSARSVLRNHVTPIVIEDYMNDSEGPMKPSALWVRAELVWKRLDETGILDLLNPDFITELIEGVCGMTKHIWMEISCPSELVGVPDEQRYRFIIDVAANGVMPQILVIGPDSPFLMLYRRSK